jgi:hypothetical protein
MKSLTFILLFLISITLCSAQQCESWYLTKKGATTTTKHYNAKSKLTGSSKLTILDATPTSKGIELNVQSQSFDEKDKPGQQINLGIRCENNNLLIDMRNFMPQDQLEAYKNMEMKMSGDYLEFPASLTPDVALKDGHMTMDISNSGMKLMTMKFDITNRKVEGIEEKTCPAGTFSCVKISYDIDMKTLFNIHLHAVEWLSKNVGVIRTEAYNKEKLQSYSELSSLTK